MYILNKTLHNLNGKLFVSVQIFTMTICLSFTESCKTFNKEKNLLFEKAWHVTGRSLLANFLIKKIQCFIGQVLNYSFKNKQ